jgi:hypothetical protein
MFSFRTSKYIRHEPFVFLKAGVRCRRTASPNKLIDEIIYPLKYTAQTKQPSTWKLHQSVKITQVEIMDLSPLRVTQLKYTVPVDIIK